MIISVFIEKLKGNDFFADFFTKEAFSQLKRYLITGFLSFGVEYALFSLLYGLIIGRYFADIYQKTFGLAKNFSSTFLGLGLSESSFRAIFACVIVYPIIFCINFNLNRHWSFKSKSKLLKQISLYSPLFIINLLLGNVLLVYFFTHTLGMSPYIAKILIMGFIVSWNFILYKKVIYR